jgi:hypothetical protein
MSQKELKCPHCGKPFYEKNYVDRQGTLLFPEFVPYYDEGYEDGFFGWPRDVPYNSQYCESIYQLGYKRGSEDGKA